MALVDPECYLGLSQEDRRAQLYEALGGTSECFYESTVLEQQKLMLEAIRADTCIENSEDFYRAWAAQLGIECVEDSEDALNQIYAYYYDAADDDSLADPDCFPGLMPDQKGASIFAAVVLVASLLLYLQPDGESVYFQPDGENYYLQP